jgi:raffinose/stachyose/melibiose transport system permease protein
VKRLISKAPRRTLVVLLALFALLWASPFLLALNSSFKSPSEFMSTGVLQPAETISFANYLNVWVTLDFPLKVMNSMIISVGGLLVSMVMAFFISYAISIGKHKWRTFVLATCVVIFLMPQEAFAYPVFLISKMVHMYGNVAFLIIPLGITGAAFATFLLGNIMNHFPVELLEAAAIDGASRWQVIRQVLIPLMMPSLLTVALLLFVANWNEYLLTLLLLPDYESQTVPLAVASLDIGDSWHPPPMPVVAAASILGAVPSFIIFALFQRSLIRGITLGSSR